MNRLRAVRQSRFTNKLLKRFLLIEFGIFIIVILLLFLLLSPMIRTASIEKKQLVNSIMVNQFDDRFTRVADYVEVISTSDNFKSALAQYLKNPSNDSNFTRVRLALNNLAILNQNYKYITAELAGGVRFDSISSNRDVYRQLLQNENYMKVLANSKASWLSPVRLYPEGPMKDLAIAVYAKNMIILGQNVTISIFFNVKDSLNYADNLAENIFDNYILYDNYFNQLLVKTPGTNDFAAFNAVEAFTSSGYQRYSDGLYFIESGNYRTCLIASYSSNNILFDNFYLYFWTTVAIFLILFLLTILLLTPNIRRALRPIHDLAGVMSSANLDNQKGDLYSTLKSDDEIGDLSRIYNEMLDRIYGQKEEIIRSEKEKQVMRFSLIVSQIDPHFIFNTMNIITFLAKKKQYGNIIKLNGALIKILQDRLRINDIEVFDSIRHEIDILNQYIMICQFRTQMSVTFIWDVDPEIQDKQIPKNILQPIVENALLHGLYNEVSGQISGEVKIAIQQNGDFIIISITDNGAGMSPDKLDEINAPLSPHSLENQLSRGRFIGLNNIKERLRLLYAYDDFFKVSSELGRGTTVIFKLEVDN
jgi:two-component system, sensor histidine kinase YesM